MHYLSSVLYIIGSALALRWFSNARRREYTDVTTSKTGADLLHLYAPRKEKSILARSFRLIYCSTSLAAQPPAPNVKLSNASPESYLKEVILSNKDMSYLGQSIASR